MTTDLDAETTENLIALALTTTDQDDEEHKQGWKAISVLQKRGTQEIFDNCASFCQNSDSQYRRVGVDILGQLGWPEHYPFRDKTLPIFFQLLEWEQNSSVLNSVGVGLGHLHDNRAIDSLLKVKDHPDPLVRHGVAFGLLAFEDERAIQTLIELSKDNDSSVRDWATFGLGVQIDADTPEQREALYERLSDDDETTRGEAMVGLARRKDPHVLIPLIAELQKRPNWILPLEAAIELADVRLLPALLSWKAHWLGEKTWIYPDLEKAIAVCWG
jgi:HEAT repeat protein